MSVWSTTAKRKEPEETVVELLRNVSLSPPKRVRVSDSWTPTNSWSTPSFEPQVEVQLTPSQVDVLFYDQVSKLSSPPSSPSPPPPSPVVTANGGSGTDEKAIILYKGVSPPLFPGGPPTGSPEPPFIVDTSGALAACKGTGNNGSNVDAGHASSALNNSSSDAHLWTGLFEGSPLYFLVYRGGNLRIRGAEFLSDLSLVIGLTLTCQTSTHVWLIGGYFSVNGKELAEEVLMDARLIC